MDKMVREQSWDEPDSGIDIDALESLAYVKSMAYALEAKDSYTIGHSERVSQTAVAISEKLHLAPALVEKIGLAGIMHDIGKIGLSESILNKPGILTPEEFQCVKRHCEMGEHILSPVLKDEIILKAVRHHHENYDGTGYPDGLKSNEIPVGARIIAVADSFDAMVSERPYRRAMSMKTACEELIKGKNHRYDSRIVDAFILVLITFSTSEKRPEFPVLQQNTSGKVLSGEDVERGLCAFKRKPVFEELW